MMNKIRFGVVGTNFISDWVIAGARQDERFELAAICSRTQETADAFAAKHGIPHTFTSLEAMAASPLVDAIYIASPNFLHAQQSILCMEHGKHVLCEKPMASNAREVRAMLDAARRNGVTLMEAMKPTLTPNFLAVRDNLRRVGTVRRYFSSYCQYSSRYDKLKEGVVLNAFKDAYNAIAEFNKIKEIYETRLRLEQSSKSALDLAQLQYMNGAIGYMDLLDAQRGYLDAQISLSNAIRDKQITMVNLYKALGGGWKE